MQCNQTEVKGFEMWGGGFDPLCAGLMTQSNVRLVWIPQGR